MSHHSITAAGYLQNAFDPKTMGEIIESTTQHIRKTGIEFDTIAFTGVSGLLIAPTVGYLMGKPLTVIRKEGESNHSGRTYEGLSGQFKYIVIDDGIAGGNTLGRIISVIQTANPSAEFTGFFGYNQFKFVVWHGTILPEWHGKLHGYSGPETKTWKMIQEIA